MKILIFKISRRLADLLTCLKHVRSILSKYQTNFTPLKHTVTRYRGMHFRKSLVIHNICVCRLKLQFTNVTPPFNVNLPMVFQLKSDAHHLQPGNNRPKYESDCRKNYDLFPWSLRALQVFKDLSNTSTV